MVEVSSQVPAKLASCRLASPEDEEAWAAYHRIRRTVLFEGRDRFDVYDAAHPDERAEGNFPKLMLRGLQCIGVIRIDIRSDLACFRRVAIDRPFQRLGFGRVLLELAETFARERGARRVESLVAPDATTFYAKCGYHEVQVQPSSASVHMTKAL